MQTTLPNRPDTAVQTTLPNRPDTAVQTTLPNRPDTAVSGTDRAPTLREALARVGPPALLAGLLLLSAMGVLPHVDAPVFDQKLLLQANLDARRMPSPERRLSSELWVVAVRARSRIRRRRS